MRRRAVVAALVVGVAAWGCAVPTQHDATRIDDGQVPFDLLEGSASVPVQLNELAHAAGRVSRRSTSCETSTWPAQPARCPLRIPHQVLAALVGGPTAEEEQSGLRSALVSDEVVNSANRLGSTVAIDLAGPFTDATAGEQRLALAQLTYAMTEIPGIDAVTFTLGGEPTSVPRLRIGERRTAPPGGLPAPRTTVNSIAIERQRRSQRVATWVGHRATTR